MANNDVGIKRQRSQRCEFAVTTFRDFLYYTWLVSELHCKFRLIEQA